MNLYSLGWSQDWQQFIETEGLKPEVIARIVSVHRSHYQAICEAGELNMYLSGRLQYGVESEDELPAVGDFVIGSSVFIDEQNKTAALIERVLPRRSHISRMMPGTVSSIQVLAANVDYAFIVTSINNDLSINRVQRYALLAEEGGVKPVLILSKVDLREDYLKVVEEIKTALPGLEVMATSSSNLEGISVLTDFLSQGQTAVFLGSSGVGKSSLTNRLIGKDLQEVKAVREGDDKGRHTTTSRELFFTEKGAMIIDTPGLREVQIYGQSESLENVFGELAGFIDACRFSDCQHEEEPGCAVQTALRSGEISQSQWENYQKMQREAAFANRKIDKRLASEEKQKWKNIHKGLRQKKKFDRQT